MFHPIQIEGYTGFEGDTVTMYPASEKNIRGSFISFKGTVILQSIKNHVLISFKPQGKASSTAFNRVNVCWCRENLVQNHVESR
jgi:hypothetical protein